MGRRFVRLAGVALVISFVLSLSSELCKAYASTLVETASQWDGHDTLGNLDPGEVWGQVFKAPTNSGPLSQLSFWIKPFSFTPNFTPSVPFDLQVTAYLMHWDGQKADGGFLLSVPVQQNFDDIPLDPQRVDFTFPAIDLTAGEKYVAFLRMTTPAAPGYATLGYLDHDAYPDGAFRGPYAGSFANLTNRPWSGNANDLAFEFRFGPVPEPSTLAIAAIGGLSLLACSKRRRSNKLA